MIRRAAPADAAAIADFLARHIETSMFLLGNLEAHGIGDTPHPHGTRFLLRLTDGDITGVFGWTNGGYAMPQWPAMTPPEAQECVAAMRGVHLRGITGPPDQVALMLGVLPVAPVDWATNRDDPLMVRALDDLPAATAHLRPAEAPDRALLEGWFAAYLRETGTSGAATLRLTATARAQAAIGSDTIRLLMHEGRPVAMGALNARAGDAVQIGGVYVAPEHRGKGLAGQLVISHLAELKAKGIRRAILFAASSAAERAYARIGFRRIGFFRVALLARPVSLGAAA